MNLHLHDWLPEEDSVWVFVAEALQPMNLLILRTVGINMSNREAYHSHQSSVANPLSNRILLISYKKRLMNTYIIDTTLLVPCHSMFQPLKDHLQDVRLIIPTARSTNYVPHVNFWKSKIFKTKFKIIRMLYLVYILLTLLWECTYHTPWKWPFKIRKMSE
jgi:hypothetical protein